MNEELIAARLREASEQYDRMKASWSAFGLPFSAYSSDFPILLLLSLHHASDDELAERLRGAATQQQRLRDLIGLGTDASVRLGLALMSEGQAAPADSVATVEPARFVPDEQVIQSPVQQTLVVVSDEEESDEEEPVDDEEEDSEEDEEAESGCVHVGSDGKCSGCTAEELDTCAGCEDDFPGSRMKRCVDEECDTAFCPDCVDEGLNENGYCSECNTWRCDGCEEDVARDSEIGCSREDCDSNLGYCDSCAKALLNEQGVCMPCSEEEEVTCDDCQETFTDSRTVRCTGAYCKSYFCGSCRESGLAEGLCESCSRGPEDEPSSDEPPVAVPPKATPWAQVKVVAPAPKKSLWERIFG